MQTSLVKVFWTWLIVFCVVMLVYVPPAAANISTVGCGENGVSDLIAAIMTANTTPTPDTIELTAGCVYTLTDINSVDEHNYGNGLPVITTPLTIVGNGAIIERNTATETPPFRFLQIASTGTLTFTTVTLRKGATRYGGAIYNQGTLTLVQSTIHSNTLAYYHSPGQTVLPTNGGGIFNSGGMVTLIQSTVRDNNTNRIYGGEVDSGSGGGVYSKGGTVILIQSTIHNNLCRSDGGGIYVRDTELILQQSEVYRNECEYGGGIVTAGGSMMLQESTVHNNIGLFFGGGIYINGKAVATIQKSTVSNNTCNRSGGGIDIYGSTLTVQNSTINGNSCDQGGGINSRDTTLKIQQSTLSGNMSTNTYSDELGGGGIYSRASTIMLEQSTITGNTALTAGGGIYSEGGYLIASLRLGSTLIAHNTAEISGTDFFIVDDPRVISYGSNLIGDHSYVTDTFPIGTPNAYGDWVGTAETPLDPLLGPLANNGGPTWTHLPLNGSLALDHGPESSDFTTDQRGWPRMLGLRVDIGAVEAFVAQYSVALPSMLKSCTSGQRQTCRQY